MNSGLKRAESLLAQEQGMCPTGGIVKFVQFFNSAGKTLGFFSQIVRNFPQA